MTTLPASPCNSVCAMDRASGLCRGCWRTLDEIAAWSALSAVQQSQVLDLIAQRRVLAQRGPDLPPVAR